MMDTHYRPDNAVNLKKKALCVMHIHLTRNGRIAFVVPRTVRDFASVFDFYQKPEEVGNHLIHTHICFHTNSLSHVFTIERTKLLDLPDFLQKCLSQEEKTP